MKPDDNQLPRLDELTDAVIDESASEQQIQELQQILEESDLARRHYVEWLAMSSSLHHYAGVEQHASVVTPPAPNADGRTHRRGQAGPAFGTSSTANWRRVAYHPACRVAAAAILVFSVGAAALWLQGAGSQPALASFIEPILEAKNATCKISTERNGQIVETSESMVLAPNRTREESSGEFPWIRITDLQEGITLYLHPETKKATIMRLGNLPQEAKDTNWILKLQSQLLEASDNPERFESLAEKDIDGQRAVGYRLYRDQRSVLEVWGNPKTGMPVRVESTWQLEPNVKTAYSDFHFNVDLDESLFRLEPPAGYTTVDVKTDNSPGKEEDLIRTFRTCAELGGGVYPNELNNRSLSLLRDRRIHESTFESLQEDQRKQVEKKLEENRDESDRSAWGFTATFGGVFEEGKEPTPQEEQAEFQEWLDESDKLTRGLSFALDLPPEADAHYAGQGVSRDTPDRPIFWYRVKETNKYRVIYADLSVREATTPPSVPDARPWPGGSSPEP